VTEDSSFSWNEINQLLFTLNLLGYREVNEMSISDARVILRAKDRDRFAYISEPSEKKFSIHRIRMADVTEELVLETLEASIPEYEWPPSDPDDTIRC